MQFQYRASLMTSLSAIIAHITAALTVTLWRYSVTAAGAVVVNAVLLAYIP